MKNDVRTKVNPQWEGLLRHLLTFAAGLLVALGIDLEGLDKFSEYLIGGVGAVIGLIGLIKSWIAPEKENAKTVAVNQKTVVERVYKMNEPLEHYPVEQNPEVHLVSTGKAPRSNPEK